MESFYYTCAYALTSIGSEQASLCIFLSVLIYMTVTIYIKATLYTKIKYFYSLELQRWIFPEGSAFSSLFSSFLPSILVFLIHQIAFKHFFLILCNCRKKSLFLPPLSLCNPSICSIYEKVWKMREIKTSLHWKKRGKPFKWRIITK